MMSSFQEEPDKYIISFKDEDIDTKEMKVDYSKELNELRLSISKNVKEEKDSSYKQYSSTYQSSIKFDKPVAGDELLADVNGGNVMITVPSFIMNKPRIRFVHSYHPILVQEINILLFSFCWDFPPNETF